MSRYQTGIGGSETLPSVMDLVTAFAGYADDMVRLLTSRVGEGETVAVAAYDADDNVGLDSDNSSSSGYDAVTQSWPGSGGLRYRVPLYATPSARHARVRARNVHVLMDNCRRLCEHDDLPSTPEERRFWASYRFLTYRLFLSPLCATAPPLYIASRMLQHRMPFVLRGRCTPLLLSFAIAEVWSEASYPAHTLLRTALRARTPLGDAARAEWARLQSLDIPFYLYSAYRLQSVLDRVPEAFLFGGNLAALCA